MRDLLDNVVEFPQPAHDHFSDWWDIQFHKVNRAICKEKWDRITSPEGYTTKMLDKTTGEYIQGVHLKAEPEEIIEAQKRQNSAFFKLHGLGDEMQAKKQFVRRPAQWLNQAGWEDE